MITITMTTRAALLAVIPYASTSFTWDCSWWRLSDNNLATECDTWGADSIPSGERVQVMAILDLNDCIGIDPGANAIVWKKGCVAPCLPTQPLPPLLLSGLLHVVDRIVELSLDP